MSTICFDCEDTIISIGVDLPYFPDIRAYSCPKCIDLQLSFIIRRKRDTDTINIIIVNSPNNTITFERDSHILRFKLNDQNLKKFKMLNFTEPMADGAMYPITTIKASEYINQLKGQYQYVYTNFF